MSDYVMGIATGMALNNAENQEKASSNTDFAIKIELCKTQETKQQIATCLLQIQKAKRDDDGTGLILIGCLICALIIFVAFMFWIAER